jgi:uronate dehydrogenase
MKRLLITGASGHLGTALRQTLKGFADIIRFSDIQPVENLEAHEEYVQCDLGDYDAVFNLIKECDAVVHLGGISTENTFENILNGNIRGAYNLYEANRRQNKVRILFASSNHVIGFHERETLLDADCTLRPDSMYGVSKGFGELLARYYYDKFGIESALVRIGSCFEKPANRRMLATWMSHADFTSMIDKIFHADRLGCPIIYGVSDNPMKWWDNRKVDYLGWSPKDSSAMFDNEAYIKEEVTDPNDPAVKYQGGGFASAGHFED